MAPVSARGVGAAAPARAERRQTRPERANEGMGEDGFDGPTPSAMDVGQRGGTSDSAGSEDGVVVMPSTAGMTTQERAKALMAAAKAAAKRGIVRVPVGSASKAKHGLAKTQDEARAEEDAKLRADVKRLKAKELTVMAEQAAKKRVGMFSAQRLDELSGDELGMFEDDSDDDDDPKAAAKYADDDESSRSFFVMHPTTKLRQYWDFLQIFLLMYIAFSVPYRIGFSEPSYGVWYIADFFIDMYFYVDMAFNFFTAYWETSSDDDDYHYVTNLWKIQKHYLKRWFIIDAVSLIPIDYISRGVDGTSACSWESEAACGAAAQDSKVPEVFRLFKMLRLLRVLRTMRILERYQETLLRVYKGVTILRLVAFLILLSHWTACLYAYVYDFTREDMSGESGQKSHMYVASLFWAVQTLTTVGYGNVVPTTVAERVVAILVMITGGFVFSAIISGVNMTMDEDSPGNRFAVLMNHVRELLAENKMPSGLQSRVRSHYKSSAKPAKLVNRDIITPLPEAIRADVNFYIYGKPMVTGLKASGTVEPDSIVIEILCRTMDTKMFARGSRMCYPYELAERVLITLTGRVTYSPDEQGGFHHADVMRIKRKRLRDQQIEIAEEKGLLRGPGTLLNPGLLSGFHKGILCAMPFDKYVEALVLDHGAFYDVCSQHQPNLLRNFEDEFFASLSGLNRPKMARVALSECDRRAFLHPETRNVAGNWRELLEKERKEQDEKRAEREKAGVMGLVTKGGLEAIDSKAMSGGGTPGATMGAIKLAMQQMHADIVNVSEQIAEVMVEVKKVGSMGEESALNTSQIVMSADAIEKKQINMELNVEAVYQAVQNLMDVGPRGGDPGASASVFDFTAGKGAATTTTGVSPFNALQSDKIRQRIEEAQKRGAKLVVTSNVVTEEEDWDSRRPTVGVQGVRRAGSSRAKDFTSESAKFAADRVFKDSL